MARNLFADDTAQQASTTSESANSTSGGRNLFAEQSTQQSNVQPQMSAEESLIAQTTGNNSLAQADVAAPASGNIDFSPEATAVREQAFKDSQTPEAQLKVAIQDNFLKQRGDDKSTGALLERNRLGIALSDTAEEKTNKVITNALDQINRVKPQPKEEAGFFETAAQTLVGLSPVGRIARALNDTGLVESNDFFTQASANAEDFTQGSVQGLSLGTADEVEGFIQSQIDSGMTYKQARDSARQRYSETQERSPYVSAAGELTGSILPAATGAGAATKLSGAANLGRYGAAATQVGAASLEGGIASAGASEADVGTRDFTSDVQSGLGWGAVFGAGGEVIAGGVDAVASLFRTSNGKEVIRQNLLNAKPEGVSVAEYADVLDAQLDNLRRPLTPETVQQLGGVDALKRSLGDRVELLPDGNYRLNDAALADLDELESFAGGLGSVAAPAPLASKTIRTRAEGAETDVLNSLSKPQREGGKYFGEVLKRADLDPDTGIIKPEVFSARITKEANTRAKPFYDNANSSVPTKDQRDTINFLRGEFPSFKRYFDMGRRNALDGAENRKSFIKALDEATKAIDADINTLYEAAKPDRNKIKRLTDNKNRFTELRVNFVDDVRAGDLADSATLSRIGVNPDDMVNPITTARQIGAEPRQLSSSIQIGAEAQATGVDKGRVLRAKAQTNALDDSYTGQSQGIGAGTVLRNRLEQGQARDAATGRLLSDAEVDNYNRIAFGSVDQPSSTLSFFLDADKRTARSAQLVNRTPQTIAEELRSDFPAFAKDIGAAASMAAFVATPNVIMAGLVSTRLGQAAVSRLTNKKLASQAQKELYKLGINKQQLEDILQGNFGRVPTDKLLYVGRVLASTVGVQATSDMAFNESDSERATR